MLSVVACVGLVLFAVQPAEAASFLAAERQWARKSVSAATVDQLLHAALPGSENAARLRAVKEELAPMYVALPKNEHGLLEHATVRYALHRHFANKYGWYVRGLAGNGEWKGNSSAEILKDRVPFHIQDVLEKRVHGRGLDLDDLTTFAGTLTELIERDALGSFQECFDSLELPRVGEVEDRDIKTVFRGYLARYLYGTNEELHDDESLALIEEEIDKIYPDWNSAVMWLEDAHSTVQWMNQAHRNPFQAKAYSFAYAVNTLQSIMRRFSDVANSGCPETKTNLMKVEYQGTGRVRLIDFYSTYSGSKPETMAYLRNLGVLDETDPERPMLLIANFITSLTNCIVDGSYYSSCCHNECEQLWGRLEETLKAPSATPSRIVEIVSHLPSATVDAPRNLSSTMVRRLNEIALVHGGQVPLHGRLFSQWMHHAYPRECPFPQTGGERPMTQEEFFEHHDLQDTFATEEEKAAYTGESQKMRWNSAPHMSADALPWNDLEELVATHRFSKPSRSSRSSQLLRVVMAVVALGTMALAVTRTLMSGARVSSTGKQVVCV